MWRGFSAPRWCGRRASCLRCRPGASRRPKRLRQAGDDAPVQQARALAAALPPRAWRTVSWRAGVAEPLASRFAAVRVRPAHGDHRRQPTPSRGMAAHRMARGRAGPDQVLALEPAGRHADRQAGLSRQATLADRARLSRAQAGTRARPLRGSRLARLPPPRCAVHRRLRLPGRRAGGDSPLRPRRRPAGRSVWRSRGLPTPRRRRCAPSATCPTR